MRDIEQTPGVFSLVSLGLPQRLILFALLFAAEWSPITNLVHKGRGAGALLQIAIAFSSLLLALGYFRSKDSFQRISADSRERPSDGVCWLPMRWRWATFLGLSTTLDG